MFDELMCIFLDRRIKSLIIHGLCWHHDYWYFLPGDGGKVMWVEDKLLENEMTVAPGYDYDKGD